MAVVLTSTKLSVFISLSVSITPVVILKFYKYGTVNLQNELSVLWAVQVEQHIIWHNLAGSG
jgi:hypothetical protein